MEIHDEITVPGQEARYGETPSWLSPAAGRLIGDAVASVVQYAREVGKPIVIERLDFRRKKAALESESRKYSRMLSSFSYGKVKAYFIGDYRAANWRAQAAVLQPSPGLALRLRRRFSRRFATGRAESCPRPYLRPPPLHGHPLHTNG